MSRYLKKRSLLKSLPSFRKNTEAGVRLDQNECPFDLPVELKVSILEKLMKLDLNRYQDELLLELKKKLAKANRLLPDQVLVTQGFNTLLQNLILSVNTAPKILTIHPCFDFDSSLFEEWGATVQAVKLTDPFNLPVQSLLLELKNKNPDLLLLANPNPVSGNLFDRDSLYRVIKAARCLVVVDESFFPLSQDTMADWLSEFDHLVLIRSFSKAFALAGLDLYYTLSDPEIIQRLETMGLLKGASGVSALVALEVMGDTHYVKGYTTLILKERQRLFTQMKMMPAITVFASDASFFLFKVENAESVYKSLCQKGVFVARLPIEGLFEQYLRVSVGTPKENEIFLEALEEVLTA